MALRQPGAIGPFMDVFAFDAIALIFVHGDLVLPAWGKAGGPDPDTAWNDEPIPTVKPTGFFDIRGLVEFFRWPMNPFFLAVVLFWECIIGYWLSVGWMILHDWPQDEYWTFGAVWECFFPVFLGSFFLARAVVVFACMASSAGHRVEGRLCKWDTETGLFVPLVSYHGLDEHKEVFVCPGTIRGRLMRPMVTAVDYLPDLEDGCTMDVYVCPWRHGRDFLGANRRHQFALAVCNFLVGAALVAFGGYLFYSSFFVSGSVMGAEPLWKWCYPLTWLLPYVMVAVWQLSQWKYGWGDSLPWTPWRSFFWWLRDEGNGRRNQPRLSSVIRARGMMQKEETEADNHDAANSQPRWPRTA